VSEQCDCRCCRIAYAARTIDHREGVDARARLDSVERQYADQYKAWQSALSTISTLRGELEEARGERDRAVLYRDNLEARIVGAIDAAFVGAAAVPLDMSHEVMWLVNCIRIRERMLATATARAEAAEAGLALLRDTCNAAVDRFVAAEARETETVAKERDRIAAWLDKEAEAMEFASKHAPTNHEARACDAEAKTLRQVAKDLRADDHHADEAGEK